MLNFWLQSSESQVQKLPIMADDLVVIDDMCFYQVVILESVVKPSCNISIKQHPLFESGTDRDEMVFCTIMFLQFNLMRLMLYIYRMHYCNFKKLLFMIDTTILFAAMKILGF